MLARKGYSTFADFERELIRPGLRIGWSVDDLDSASNIEDLDFDLDPLSQEAWGSEQKSD